jgi:hypothetical protein
MSKAAELAALIGSQTALSNRNLIINGSMNVAQRSTSATGVGASTAYNAQDRWKFFTIGSAAARWTQSVSTDVPASSTFTTSLKLDCTTASGTVGSDDRQQLMQPIEAQNLQPLRYGSSAAKKVTLSFWVKSSVTGKNYCMFYHDDGTRFTYKSYTVDSADTWEFKTLTFSGDTASAITNDSGAGLNIIWMLYLGSDYTSATDGVEDTWAAWNSGNYDQFNGQVNNASSTDNNWYLTGVQLEVGEQATPFEHPRSIGDELFRCQRYFQRMGEYSTSSYPVNGQCYVYASTSVAGSFQLISSMRTSSPTVSFPNGDFGVRAGSAANNQYEFSSINSTQGATQGVMQFDATVPSGIQLNTIGVVVNAGNNRYMFVDAEL